MLISFHWNIHWQETHNFPDKVPHVVREMQINMRRYERWHDSGKGAESLLVYEATHNVFASYWESMETKHKVVNVETSSYEVFYLDLCTYHQFK